MPNTQHSENVARIVSDLQTTNFQPTEQPITITVVSEEACPECSAFAGHPDPALDFFNRPKVGDENGDWWWRCYNPLCSTDYYLPSL